MQQLQQMGFETYVRPYFPGYLFVRVDLSQVSLSTFQWMPHTEGLVCFEARPAHVPDRLLEAMRRRVADETASQVRRATGKPDDVLYNQLDAPGDGYESILDLNLSGAERVHGLLRMLEDLGPPSEPAQG